MGIQKTKSVKVWCHLLVLVLCVNAAIYQKILEYFLFPSVDELYGNVDFIFQ